MYVDIGAPMPDVDTERDIIERLRAAFEEKVDERQPRGVRERLFPFSRGGSITWFDVVYAEVLWTAILLVSGFVAFATITLGPVAAVSFVAATIPYMLPILGVWSLVGLYMLRKQQAYASRRQALSGTAGIARQGESVDFDSRGLCPR